MVTEYYPESLAADITGGVEAETLYISQALARDHDVIVICSWQRGQERVAAVGGATVHRVGPHHRYSNAGDITTRLRFAHAAYRTGVDLGPFDIVHGFNVLTFVPAYHIARRTGAKAIATYQEVWKGAWVRNKGVLTGVPGEIWERWALSRDWDHVISISEFTRDRLVTAGVPAERITVVPCGVPLETLRGIDAKKRPRSIVCVNRLVSTKRPDTLLRSLEIIRKEHPELAGEITCSFIGSGDDEERFRSMAGELGLSDRVTFEGFIADHREVLRRIRSASVLVHPSGLEGFGIVLLEALALGTPVICSDIEVFREVTQLAGSGTLFRLGDAGDLAEKLVAFFEGGPPDIPPMDRFDWRNIAERVEQVYESTVHS